MASPVAFPFPAGPTLRAHSTPVSVADLDERCAVRSGGVLVRAGEPVPAAAVRSIERFAPEPRPDRAAPVAAVDSRGVPGLFCLWILNYLRRVGNVFSFRFLHLHYRDTTLTGATANDVKPIRYSPVPEHTNQRRAHPVRYFPHFCVAFAHVFAPFLVTSIIFESAKKSPLGASYSSGATEV